MKRLLILLVLLGCNNKENPKGPRAYTQLHFSDCKSWCTATTWSQPHVRR